MLYLARRLLKWGTIGAAVTIGTALLVFLVLSRFAGDDAPELVPAGPPTIEQQAPVGGRQFDYQVPDSRVPRDERAEAAAPPIALIPERQQTPVAPVVAPAADERALTALVNEFLPAYETFRPDQDRGDYARGFASLVVPDRLDAVASRQDNHAPIEVGVCEDCSTGSVFTTEIDPGLYLTVRRYSSDNAYITTQGNVRYTGQGVAAGRTFRRSYALLVSRLPDGWRVHRVASETLALEPGIR